MAFATSSLSPAERIKIHRLHDPEMSASFGLHQPGDYSSDEGSSAESECVARSLFDDGDLESVCSVDSVCAVHLDSPRCDERMDFHSDQESNNWESDDSERAQMQSFHEAASAQKVREVSSRYQDQVPEQHAKEWSVSPAARTEILEHLTATQTRLEAAQEVLLMAEDEKIELETELDDSLLENQDLQLSNQELEEQNVELIEENELVGVETDRLAQLVLDNQRENDRLNAENRALGDLAQRFREENNTLQQENDRLSQLCDEAHELQDVLIDDGESLREGLEEREDQGSETRESLQVVYHDLQVARKAISQLQVEIKEAVEEQELELEDLAGQLDQAEREGDVWRHHAQDLLAHVSELLHYKEDIDAKPTEMLEATIELLRVQIKDADRKLAVAEGTVQVLAKRSPRSSEEFEEIELKNAILMKRMAEYEQQMMSHREEMSLREHVIGEETPEHKARMAEPDTPYGSSPLRSPVYPKPSYRSQLTSVVEPC